MYSPLTKQSTSQKKKITYKKHLLATLSNAPAFCIILDHKKKPKKNNDPPPTPPSKSPEFCVVTVQKTSHTQNVITGRGKKKYKTQHIRVGDADTAVRHGHASFETLKESGRTQKKPHTSYDHRSKKKPHTHNT